MATLEATHREISGISKLLRKKNGKSSDFFKIGIIELCAETRYRKKYHDAEPMARKKFKVID